MALLLPGCSYCQQYSVNCHFDVKAKQKLIDYFKRRITSLKINHQHFSLTRRVVGIICLVIFRVHWTIVSMPPEEAGITSGLPFLNCHPATKQCNTVKNSCCLWFPYIKLMHFLSTTDRSVQKWRWLCYFLVKWLLQNQRTNDHFLTFRKFS